MLRVYVIKAENLVIADITGASDPYVKLYSLYHGKRYQFSRTKPDMKTINPSWDRSCREAHLCPFCRTQFIYFKVFDYDKMKADDLLGYCQTQVTPFTIGRELKLRITNNEKKESYLYVKILPPIDFFPKGVATKKTHALYVFLQFRPSFNESAIVPIRMRIARLANGLATEIKEQIPHVLKFSEVPDCLGTSGFTQVFRFNLNKASSIYLPFIELLEEWSGVVTVKVAGAVKEPKKGNKRMCNTELTNTMNIIGTSDVAVEHTGLYNSGLLMKLSTKKLPEFVKIGSEFLELPFNKYAREVLAHKVDY